MNNPITSTEIEAVIKKSPKEQKPRTRWLHRILSNVREELMPILLKLFQKISEEGTLPKSFYEATITLISKLDKDNTQKENYRPMSLMDIDARILNKIGNEKGELTTDNSEIQRIIRDYYEKLYGNKIDNLEEMYRFLEKFNLPRLNQEEI